MACNMSCKHCGSRCNTQTRPDELTMEEIEKVAFDLGKLGVIYVTLSGGEPLLHPRWEEIAKILKKNNVIPNMISNGWFITEDVISRALKAGISNIACSLDGLKSTHDYIRQEGAFDRVNQALEIMTKMNMPSSIITTITRMNMEMLDDIYQYLVKKKVYSWQIQIGTPMGNLKDRSDQVILPLEIDQIIDFAHKVMKEEKLKIHIADCIGYYSIKDVEVRKNSSPFPNATGIWSGCGAGKNSLGILSNGDIVGCTSIRFPAFIEANVKEKSLVEIWNNPSAFSWNRDLTCDELVGFCGMCKYAWKCLGGCSTSKTTFVGNLKENLYCSYRISLEEWLTQISFDEHRDEYLNTAQMFISEQDFQKAILILEKGFEINRTSLLYMQLLAFVYFKLKFYYKSLELNMKILLKNPQDAYSWKGLGLCYYSIGKTDDAIDALRKSILLNPQDEDAKCELLQIQKNLSV